MKVIILLSIVALSWGASLGEHHAEEEHHREPIPILRDERVQNEEGSYSFDFETGDGVSRSESGSRLTHLEEQPIGQQGEVKFTFPSGEEFVMKYVADENGYQPESDWIPVAPEFPHEIPQFVLDQIAKARLEDEAAAADGISPDY